MARTQVRAFKCAGCDYLTTNEDDLQFRAKVTVIPESGSTLKAHTPGCLVQAVASELGLVVGDIDEEPLPEGSIDPLEQYETGDELISPSVGPGAP